MTALAALMLTAAAVPGAGIPDTLAKERAAAIRALRYELELRIPASRRQPLRGRAIVRFTLAAPHRIVLDFATPRDRVLSVTGARGSVEAAFSDNHVIIPAGYTTTGENAFTIEFLAGDESLNRNDEFLYTLFVPARAHLAFPCFDQPDLKARYTLRLDVPQGWEAVANGAAVSRQPKAAGYRIAFAETQPLPTYLFSFAAGKFQVETAARNGRELRMLHRETDAAKVARNRDAIFDLHASALSWLESYTGIAYPFGKFDFVLIPSFQFGGMEHAGAILYNASGLLLDPSATQNQYLGRASLIAHETAHMWFGDLVTMRWFDDVWMKEVFANFMAAKIVNPSFPEVNHELRFLLAHYPAAYDVDRTAGANPIRQQLANLSEAGQLYGAIIYQKAPIVMRQLELIVGEQVFRDGLRAYLKKHSFGNASWLDLIATLDDRSTQDLAAWSRAWVEERGRPEFSVSVAAGSVTLTSRDPLGRGLVWPQRLQVTIVTDSGVRHERLFAAGWKTTIPLGGAQPRLVLPNGGGLGYGLFVLDEGSRAWLLEQLPDLPDALTRGAAWVTLWDNLVEGLVDRGAFLDLAGRALAGETDEQNAQRILNYVVRAYWRFVPQDERLRRAASLEQLLRDGIARAATASRKSAWFAAFRDVVQTRTGLAWLERVWKREEKIPGLTFAETDEIAMAMELAVREVPGWQQILATQHERIENPDRKERFAFVRPALSADPAEREMSFARFRTLENRRREPWVIEAQQYLNHPLREAHARRFIRPSLELLQEIQRTGDIFFPKRWMDATLGGHRTPEAASTVESFLASRPSLPQRLRWTVLSSLDELARAARHE
jgi:aminopeptidase N